MALTDTLVEIGDAIRAKDGTGAPIPFLDMPERIRAIPSGGDVDGVMDKSITGTLYLTASVIGTYALYGCAQLEAIDAPNVVRIENTGCSGCSQLAVVNFPVLERIDPNALRNTALVKLDAPITNIGTTSLQGSAAFNTLILRAGRVCTLASVNAFADTQIASGAGYIYVPAEWVSNYKSATNWTAFANQIRAIEDYPEITGGAR